MSSRFEVDSNTQNRMKRHNPYASDASTADMNTKDPTDGIVFGNGILDGTNDRSENLKEKDIQPKKEEIDNLVYPSEVSRRAPLNSSILNEPSVA